jgi:TonB family protein
MTDFLIYDLKVALLIAVFYMFYRLLLARETFHHVNRIVLLTTAVASYVLPLCVITFHETVVMQQTPTVTIDGLQASAYEPASAPLWQIVLPILFIIGVAAAIGHTLYSLIRIIRLISHSEQHPQADGTTICVTGNADLAPFSWMHYIVMNRSDYDISDASILAHERGHIRLHHSCDVILVDLITALQWFNPAMWMLRSDLRAIHEYEADAAVLSQGINARQYQYLLITKAGGIGGYSLANGITHSALKNRITMMTNKTSKSSHLLKLLALLPIVGVTLALNAETVTDYVYNNDEPQKQVPVKKGRQNAAIKNNGKTILQVVEAQDQKTEAEAPKTEQKEQKGEVVVVGYATPNERAEAPRDVFDVVEKMPEFPGGPQELFGFLAKTIKYPAEAEKAGTQGRVIATFVVRKDCSISDAHVVKSVDPLLDAEALRVINAMPAWTPGSQSGKPVNVKYTVPITFRLDGKTKEAPAAVGIFTPTETSQKSSDVVKYEGTVKYNNVRTIRAAETPLVVVDDKTIDFEKMKDIDPKTIEKMTVLKDKAATDLYGDKAKHGVIVITTKK